MPRYNANERIQIVLQMHKEVRDCLKKYGVRKTSVDELVRKVNIPKGTFYLFFPSKEDLIYDVICEYRKEILQNLLQKLEAEPKLTATNFLKIINEIFYEVSTSFLVEVERNNEMEFLFKKLPKEKVEEQEAEINRLYDQLKRYVCKTNDEEFEVLLTASMLLFKTTLAKEEFGEQLYYNSIKMLLNGISLQYMNKGAGDDVPFKGNWS